MEKIFKNRYGSVELKTITPFMPVKEIKGADYPSDIKLSLSDAEKVALITGNLNIQICFDSLQTAYIILHNSPSTAAICKAKISYISDRNPEKELEKELEKVPFDYALQINQF